MIPLFIDIETIPDQRRGALEKFLEQEPVIDASKFTIDQLCIDLNKDRAPTKAYKKADLVEEWQQTIGEQKRLEKARENHHRTALNGGYGQIIVVGYGTEDQATIATSGNSEYGILTILKDNYHYLMEKNRGLPIQFVGHNVLNFDLKFLYQRMVINGIKPPFDYPISPYSDRVFDTMTRWAGYGNRISLNELCNILDVPSPKGELDGSKVYEYYLAGKINEIAEYCKKDVEAVKQIYYKMIFKELT